MVEYEYRVLKFTPDVSRSDIRRTLADHAEYGHWELARLRLYPDGTRKVTLRRRILRVARAEP